PYTTLFRSGKSDPGHWKSHLCASGCLGSCLDGPRHASLAIRSPGRPRVRLMVVRALGFLLQRRTAALLLVGLVTLGSGLYAFFTVRVTSNQMELLPATHPLVE